jgi:hypothetical protein
MWWTGGFWLSSGDTTARFGGEIGLARWIVTEKIVERL